MAERTYLVAGLGNIGAEYEQTRHNMGFMVLDAWVKASNTFFESKRYGDIATISVKGRKFVLLKPSTYMNLSGNAIRYWLGELNLDAENLMVICDDLNLPFGTLRLRAKGSDGGHNGLKNIIEVLGTENFARLRMGIGHDFAAGGQIDFVLGKLSQEEITEIPAMSEVIVKGLSEWAFMGISRAMNTINVQKHE